MTAPGPGLFGPVFCSLYENNASCSDLLFSKYEQRSAFFGLGPEPLSLHPIGYRFFFSAAKRDRRLQWMRTRCLIPAGAEGRS